MDRECGAEISPQATTPVMGILQSSRPQEDVPRHRHVESAKSSKETMIVPAIEASLWDYLVSCIAVKPNDQIARHNMKIITITGYKGGCGKSMTAVHVATFFSDRGNTLLVDSDPNRTALHWSDRGSLPFEVVDERKAMKSVAGRDWVVIDTPARPDSSDLKELSEGADLLILPTVPDIVSLDPMLQTASALGKANYRALLTIVPPRPSKEGETMRDELRDNGVPVFETMIRRAAGFQKAALAGVPVREMGGRDSLGWMDYQSLGKEILEVIGDE